MIEVRRLKEESVNDFRLFELEITGVRRNAERIRAIE